MATTYKRFTLSDRITIQNALDNRISFRMIAFQLGRHASSIQREVRRHSIEQNTFSFNNNRNRCIHRMECDRHDLCPGMSIKCKNKKCSSCRTRPCNFFCQEFIELHCPLLEKPPYVCNGCPKRISCNLRKKIYSAQKADQEASLLKSESRSGISLTKEEIDEFDQRISPLIQKGQSIHHIMISNPDWFTISEKTAYMLVHSGLIQARTIDLPRAVRFKPRKKSRKVKVDKKCRIGRSYDDYLFYVSEHPDESILQGDTVEGTKGGKCILTLTWVSWNFQIGFLRDHNDSASVSAIVDHLYQSLGEDTFRKVMPSIWLLDNGTEFSNPAEIEKYGIHVFYCNPSAPYQKGACENTHEHIRRILPKGTSFNDLTQEFLNLMFSHMNAMVRKKLNNRSAYDLFSSVYGDDVDILAHFGISRIEPNDVKLTPELRCQYFDETVSYKNQQSLQCSIQQNQK